MRERWKLGPKQGGRRTSTSRQTNTRWGGEAGRPEALDLTAEEGGVGQRSREAGGPRPNGRGRRGETTVHGESFEVVHVGEFWGGAPMDNLEWREG